MKPLFPLLLACGFCTAEIETLFVIGEDDNSHEPFGSETSSVEAAPGSPLLIDDHFYVSSDEPTENFERAVTVWDPSIVIHFDLTAEQTNPDGVFEFAADFLWSGQSGGLEASNIVTYRLNGVDFLTTPLFESYQEFRGEITAIAGLVQTGANTLEIIRSGGTPNTWLAIDYVELTVDATANQDTDGDGLPLRWETLYQLSDNNPLDASENFDDDLLTNLEEFQAGTSPRNPDSDRDGLADHLELTSSPLNPDSDNDGLLDGEETSSDPSLADTDNDGAFDAWEIRTGYDPAIDTSTPPPFSGAIGINFRSDSVDEKSLWSARAPNGWIPQTNWNHTEPLRHWGVSNGDPLLTGDTSHIFSPTEGTLVDAAGNALATTIAFTYDGCPSNSNFGTRAAELLNGYLRSDESFNPTIALTNIPYLNYDLYLYLSADYIGPEGSVRLNGDPASDITLRPKASSPTREFLPAYQTSGPNTPLYNTVRFSGVSGTSATLELLGDGSSGIAAIQIVDRDADADSDLIPDYWELHHRTDAGLSNASADPDGDLLTNAEEFSRGTDPNNPDSDGDGLSDFVETNSGNFIDANNTGTDPLFADSDGDSLSDGAELTGLFATNPLLSDSDGDGEDDSSELSNHTDPNSVSHNLIPVPTFPTSDSLLWRVTDIQVVQNHLTPANTRWNSERFLLSFNVTNAQQPGWRTLELYLMEEEGRLGYFFATRRPGGFSHPNNYDLYLGDKTIDYRPALGFSGYGPCDVSDPLTFELAAAANPSPATDWTLNLSIFNQKTQTVVASRVFTTAVAASSIIDQTATWRDEEETPNQGSMDTGTGIQAFRSATPLETLPAFAAHLDSDDDGIPDSWELANGLDPNLASDAEADPDGDLLNNREEYFHNTFPNLADSDGDGVNDNEEVAQFSDPRDATSSPPYFDQALSYNEDLDGNGLPDVWEAAYQAIGLLAGGDDDGDGFSNAEEATAGTDPLNASSLPFLDISSTATALLRLSWPNIPGKNQSLVTSQTLLTWDPLSGLPSASGEVSWMDVSPDDERRFFTVGFSDRNSDGDPLSDWTELALGFSPTDTNSVSRPFPLDSNSDGQGDLTTPGDLAVWHQTFANSSELANGGPVASPTSFDASRLLMQATFGPTLKEIEEVQALGLEAWIDDQIQNQPPTFHSTYIEEIYQDFDGPRIDTSYSFNEMDDFLNDGNYNTAFARAAISGPDQLRQRVAFALSQILVVSRRDANLSNRLVAVSDYYDLLVENAFGNYEDLLMDITLHPTMGRYLSHIGNQPPAPEINRYPDENYARELMQLFTIGLWELEQDGTRKLNAGGNAIPTYSNEEITNFARVMTGLWFGGNPWGQGGWQDPDYAIPMEMHSDYHDFEPKTLLNDLTIPRRPVTQENALLDIQDAIRNLFEHPNCAPFVSKALIQFLVTSNPSPAYVQRVAGIFADDGTGERGNLAAVVKAILMDQDARDPATANSAEFGIFREPVIRTMHLARLTKLNQNQNLVWWDYGEYYAGSFQQALSSPSVFNFYRPDYKAPGTLTQNGLVGPALEITNSYSAVSFPNQLWQQANYGFSLYDRYSYPADYSDFLPYVSDHEALLDYLNLVVCTGHMNAQTRSIVLTALDNTDPGDNAGRVRLALYLALMSPQGAVQR